MAGSVNTASAFNQLGQYANSHGAYGYAELATYFLSV